MLRLALFAALALAAFCALVDEFDDIPSEYKIPEIRSPVFSSENERFDDIPSEYNRFDIPTALKFFDNIPDEYMSLIPSEVTEFFNAIPSEEKEIIKDHIENHRTFRTEQELLAAVKEKLPSLTQRVVRLGVLLQEKYMQLDMPTQELVKKVIAKGRELYGKYLAGERPLLETLKSLAIVTLRALFQPVSITDTLETTTICLLTQRPRSRLLSQS